MGRWLALPFYALMFWYLIAAPIWCWHMQGRLDELMAARERVLEMRGG